MGKFYLGCDTKVISPHPLAASVYIYINVAVKSLHENLHHCIFGKEKRGLFSPENQHAGFKATRQRVDYIRREKARNLDIIGGPAIYTVTTR